jgi:hypothetical protein
LTTKLHPQIETDLKLYASFKKFSSTEAFLEHLIRETITTDKQFPAWLEKQEPATTVVASAAASSTTQKGRRGRTEEEAQVAA